MSTVKALIAGASGITGIELIKILDNHDNCEIISVLSRTYAGEKISSKFKNTLSLKNNKDLLFKDSFLKLRYKAIRCRFFMSPIWEIHGIRKNP